MTIVHIAEAFEGGVIEFIRYIIHFDTENIHLVYYGKRKMDSLKVAEEFNRHTRHAIKWEKAQRGISFKKDYLAYKEMSVFLDGLPDDNYVIHLHSSKAGVIGRLWGLFNKYKKIIYTPHGISYIRKDISFIEKSIYQILEFVSSSLSGTVIGVSKSERDTYALVDKSAKYINNGIIINHSFDKRRKTGNEPFTIVSTGRLIEQKNPALFNQIAEHFKDNKRIQFVWLGDGELRHLITSSNISVTGWLKKEDIFKGLLDADLYLSTALWEGLPFAVLEAMNCQLPLLLYRSVGNVDLVKEGENGFLFDNIKMACDKIDELANNKAKSVFMGEKSFEYLCTDFDAQHMAKAYYEEYEKCYNK